MAIRDNEGLTEEDQVRVQDFGIRGLQFVDRPVEAQRDPQQTVILLDMVIAVGVKHTACTISRRADRRDICR